MRCRVRTHLGNAKKFARCGRERGSVGDRGAQEKRVCPRRPASMRGKAQGSWGESGLGVEIEYSPGGENTVIPKAIFLETQCHWRVLIPATSTKAGKSAA